MVDGTKFYWAYLNRGRSDIRDRNIFLLLQSRYADTHFLFDEEVRTEIIWIFNHDKITLLKDKVSYSFEFRLT